MVTRPTEPFYDASHHTPARKSQLKDRDELEPVRDKDNVARSPAPPTFTLGGGAKNLAPRGTLGIKRNLPAPDHHKGRVDPQTEQPESKGWTHGGITTMKGYNFSVKLADLPAEGNLGHGRIERLVVYQDRTPVVNYDRGWMVKPSNARDLQAVEKIREVFDRPEREFAPIAPKFPDKDRGHDR